MPPFPLPESDIKAIVEFIHSLTGASRGQGAPPVAEGPPPNIVVGDATSRPGVLCGQLQYVSLADRRSAGNCDASA